MHKGCNLVMKELSPLQKIVLPAKVNEEPKPSLHTTDCILVPTVLPSNVFYAQTGEFLPVDINQFSFTDSSL